MKKFEATKAHESLDELSAAFSALKAIDSFIENLERKDQTCQVTLWRNNRAFVLDSFAVDEHLLGFIRIYFESKYDEARQYLRYDMEIPRSEELLKEESS